MLLTLVNLSHESKVIFLFDAFKCKYLFILTVFQGLIRTCSHPPIVDLEQSDEDKPETGVRSITYKDYIEIWTGLFSSPKIKASCTCYLQNILFKNYN